MLPGGISPTVQIPLTGSNVPCSISIGGSLRIVLPVRVSISSSVTTIVALDGPALRIDMAYSML